MPRRHQKPSRHELKGWHKPPDSIVITRPSRFGNPYKVRPYGPYTAEEAAGLYERDLLAGGVESAPGRPPTTIEELRRRAGGLDVVCTCDLDAACHGDVILKYANT
ncbi:hypothetical protein DP939_10275 [Spongiactinospora rosea]|uniref:DUF4326 domain-containing protein n=1 Tax=Spongiactinospora rosea TaxID=2248750 RepID=A0A366M3M7_9ACTN|nr:DUF4326 domain-containing protein [Spongiactinospora rosea]RBQ20194.1 hypothetical protein DP939_10275 [Spongiactinospora rosea]